MEDECLQNSVREEKLSQFLCITYSAVITFTKFKHIYVYISILYLLKE